MKNFLLASTLLFLSVLGLQGQSDNTSIFGKYAGESLEVIHAAAQEISIVGVGMVAYIPGDSTHSWVSEMKVMGKFANDKLNLVAIVYSKAGEMAVTLQDSGVESRKEIAGEFGYQGGVCQKVSGGYLLSAFSGASGQDDADVAKIGLEWLAAKFPE